MKGELMREEWRDIKGYEGLYMVSNLGRVKSMSFRNNITTIKRERLISTQKNRVNRVYVSLYKEGSRKNCTVHRLVATAFIDNPYNYPEVNHIDGNPSNNNVNNLEWCTKKQNALHAYENGLSRFKAYNEEEAKKVIRDDGVIYESIRACARAEGVTQRSIKDCITHRKGLKSVKGHSFKLLEEGRV